MVPWYWYRPTSLYVYLDMAQTWLRSTAGIWSTSFIEQLRNLVLALPISSKDGGSPKHEGPDMVEFSHEMAWGRTTPGVICIRQAWGWVLHFFLSSAVQWQASQAHCQETSEGYKL